MTEPIVSWRCVMHGRRELGRVWLSTDNSWSALETAPGVDLLCGGFKSYEEASDWLIQQDAIRKVKEAK